jgi:hypothetical protein
MVTLTRVDHTLEIHLWVTGAYGGDDPVHPACMEPHEFIVWIEDAVIVFQSAREGKEQGPLKKTQGNIVVPFAEPLKLVALYLGVEHVQGE